MNVQNVNKRVKAIEAATSDDEAAHGMEDHLWLDVLIAIADGHPDSKALATAALKTVPLEFFRWYA